MFTVNAEFTAEQEAESRRQFEERLRDWIEERYPEVSWPPGNIALTNRIHTTVDRALAYGLSTEQAAATYVDWSFAHGDQFEQQPRFRKLLHALRQPEPDPGDKIRRAEAELYRAM